MSLLSGLLVCESCGSRFIAVSAHFYGCASYKQGGLAACSNTARVKRPHVEALILAEIESDILSDEAIGYFELYSQYALQIQAVAASIRVRGNGEGCGFFRAVINRGSARVPDRIGDLNRAHRRVRAAGRE